MNELIRLKPLLEEYAKKVASCDDRIYEIVLIGSLVNNDFKSKSDIDVVCLFAPDFMDMNEAWSALADISEKLKKYKIQIGISHPIDLGYMNEHIINLGGLISGLGCIYDYAGKYLTLWRTKDSELYEFSLPFDRRIKQLCELCDQNWGCEICMRCENHCNCFLNGNN